MHSPTQHPLARLAQLALSAVASAIALVALALLPCEYVHERSALAAGPGALTIKTKEIDEKNGEWHVKVRIDMARPPSMMHTPMRFTFSKEAVDERAIMSKGAEPVHHRVVLETAAKQIVGLDIDFADASGKVFKSTVFEFDLKRSDGYFEAGEYVVGLAGPDGDVGNNQRIVLKGDNPPVYRGAMDFTDNKSTKRGMKLQTVNSGIDAGSDNKEVAKNDTPEAKLPTTGDVAPVGTAPDMVPQTSYNRTAEEETVHEHPGCGCVAAGLERGSVGGGAAAAALGLAFVVSRRRRRGALVPLGTSSAPRWGASGTSPLGTDK
ncbi:MAG TPA: hypothetical protein VN894_08345 [Polyangiaceae bacterium]|nr:hypothetical protein [Polyangiaceae bacterium]